MTESSIIHSKSKQSFSEDLPDYSHESFASATSESESETSGSNTHSHTDSFGSPTSGSSNISPVSVVKHSISLPEINGMPKPEVIKKSVSVPNFQLNSATSFALQSNIVLFNSKMKSNSSSRKLRQQNMEEEKMKQKKIEQIQKEYGDWNEWQNEVKDTQKQVGEKVKWIYGVFKEIVDSVELVETKEEEIKVCEEGCVPVGKVLEDDKMLIYDLKFSRI
uniref:Uncharacterized protein n=1 Tax=Meloidogyne enterolobii TaxID=390850 RepID=A0A6V7U4Z0_MELEN|nr:unnamed protein product [Meloidogyne enterolobii]